MEQTNCRYSYARAHRHRSHPREESHLRYGMRAAPFTAFVVVLVAATIMSFAHILHVESAYAASNAYATGHASLSTAGASQGIALAAQSQKAKLLKTLRKNTDEIVCRFVFINKAKTQTVVITTNDPNIGFQGYNKAKVWIVTRSKAAVFYKSSTAINDGAAWPNSIWRKKVKGGCLFKLEEGGYADAPETKLFFISKGKASRVAAPGIDLTEIAPNRFRVRESKSKHRILGPGNKSQNYYYFRWNGSHLVEYGGKQFSYKRLQATEAGSRVSKRILETEKVKSAYYRDNGDINLNCISYGGECFNVLLHVNKDKVQLTKRNSSSDKLVRASEGGWISKRIPGSARKPLVSYPAKLPNALQKSNAFLSQYKKPKTYWYAACFTPKSLYASYRNNPNSIYHVAGCRAVIGKSSFKLKGKLFRDSSYSRVKTSPKSLLSSKSRSFKIRAKVKFYTTGGPGSYTSRTSLLSMLKSWNKSRFGTVFFKCVNGEVVEARTAAA